MKEYKLKELQAAMQPFIQHEKLKELQELLAKFKIGEPGRPEGTILGLCRRTQSNGGDDIMPTQHALLSASGAHRWHHVLGSPLLEGLPDQRRSNPERYACS